MVDYGSHSCMEIPSCNNIRVLESCNKQMRPLIVNSSYLTQRCYTGPNYMYVVGQPVKKTNKSYALFKNMQRNDEFRPIVL